MKQLGPYQLDKVIGRGGMGTVYSAVDATSGRPAAVKVLAESRAGDEHFQARFEAEIETLKQLRHPHIVTLIGYGRQDGQLFYAMELVDGRSLQEELDRGRRFAWREVVRIGLETSSALRHAHEAGVIHRDIKPANIMLDPEQRVKLSDFGIAKLFHGAQLTAIGGAIGTADYMSPEQADGRPATLRSDLYSLGCVLYTLLARRTPFQGKSVAQVVSRVINDPPPDLERLAPDAPDELIALIEKLLEKSADNRVATALALSHKLRDIGLHAGPAQVDEDGFTIAAPKPTGDDVTIPGDDGSDARATSPANRSGDDAVDRDLTALGKESPTRGRTTPDEAVSNDALNIAAPPETHFTTVDRGRLAAEPAEKPAAGNRTIWLMGAALLLIVALAAGGVVFASLPPSADELYTRISRAAKAGDDEELAAMRNSIDDFMARFPDDERGVEIEGYQRELELQQLRDRFLRGGASVEGTSSLDPAAALYLQAVALSREDAAAAAVKMRAIVEAFDGDESRIRRQVVKLARGELPRLAAESTLQKQSHTSAITDRLDHADQLRTTDPAAAAAIYRGIITLYADKPWAEELVARAESSL